MRIKSGFGIITRWEKKNKQHKKAGGSVTAKQINTDTKHIAEPVTYHRIPFMQLIKNA